MYIYCTVQFADNIETVPYNKIIIRPLSRKANDHRDCRLLCVRIPFSYYYYYYYTRVLILLLAVPLTFRQRSRFRLGGTDREVFPYLPVHIT